MLNCHFNPTNAKNCYNVLNLGCYAPYLFNIYIIFAVQKKRKMRIFVTILALLLTCNTWAQDFNTLCNSGTAAFEKKEYGKAAELFGKAVLAGKNRNEKTYALANLAYSQQHQGNLQLALESCNKAMELSGNNTQVMMLRGRVFMAMDSVDRALDDMCEVVRREPRNCDALLERAYAYTESGKYGQAMDDYRKLMEISPELTAIRLGMIRLYLAEERFNEAIILANLLIEEEPDNAGYYIARSNIERKLGQYELALMDVEEAIKIEPHNASHYTLQSILYMDLGRKEEASNSRRKAENLSEHPLE